MPTDNPKETPPAKWLTIPLTGLVSLIVGVGTALILDYLRTSAAKLEYEVISSSAFSGQVQKVAMIAIELQNSGRKELELVTGRIQIKGATILESKTEGFPTRGLSEAKSNETYSIELPFLNPSERGRILLLLNLTAVELAPPIVELRAKGTTGTQRTKERTDKKDKMTALLLPVAAAFSSLSAFAALRILRRRRDRWYTTSHRDDQRDVAAYVLDACGLTDEARSLRLQVREMSYWSIADQLTQNALTKNDSDHIRKVIRALESLLKYASIAETSCFLVNYDLARLYNRVGDKEKAKSALALARKENHKVIDKRIALTDDLNEIAPVKLNTKTE